jgi:hypothetical protein
VECVLQTLIADKYKILKQVNRFSYINALQKCQMEKAQSVSQDLNAKAVNAHNFLFSLDKLILIFVLVV